MAEHHQPRRRRRRAERGRPAPIMRPRARRRAEQREADAGRRSRSTSRSARSSWSPGAIARSRLSIHGRASRRRMRRRRYPDGVGPRSAYPIDITRISFGASICTIERADDDKEQRGESVGAIAAPRAARSTAVGRRPSTGQPKRHRDEDPRVVALDQQRDASCRALSTSALQLLGAPRPASRLTETITSPGRTPAFAAAPPTSSTTTPSASFDSLLLLRRQRTHGDAELALRRAARRRPARSSRRFALADGRRSSSFALPSRHTSSFTVVPGFDRGDQRRQVATSARSSLPSNFRITSPGLRPAFAAGPSFSHRADQRAAPALSGRSSRRAPGSLPGSLTPRRPCAHLAVRDDLVLRR